MGSSFDYKKKQQFNRIELVVFRQNDPLASMCVNYTSFNDARTTDVRFGLTVDGILKSNVKLCKSNQTKRFKDLDCVLYQ